MQLEARLTTAQGPLSNAEQLGRIFGEKYHSRSRPTPGRQDNKKFESSDLGPGMAGDAPGGGKRNPGARCAALGGRRVLYRPISKSTSLGEGSSLTPLPLDNALVF